MTQTTPSRYSPIARALHWWTAILVLLAFIYGPGGSELRVYLSTRDFDRQLHETLGMLVFALTFVRVAWKALDTAPAPEPMPAHMLLAARAAQGALILLLVLVPATAIMGAWLEGHPLTLLGGLQIAPALAESHALGTKIAALHTWLGDTIMWIAGLHAAAAIYHHVILKDRVLRSMLPGKDS